MRLQLRTLRHLKLEEEEFIEEEDEEEEYEEYDQEEEENQIDRSLFVDLISLVNDVPREYMHLVCLGVVKKLLKCYVGLSFTCTC